MPQRLFHATLYALFFFAGFYLARLFLSPAQYLANLSTTLTTLCAFALVFLAYYFSAQAQRRRQEQHQLLLHTHRESLRPSIHAQLRPNASKPELIELVLSNQGKGFANQVRTQASATAQGNTAAAQAIIQALQPLSAIQNGLDGLAAGESHVGLFADITTLAQHFAPEPLRGILTLQTQCTDSLGTHHTSESQIDLSALAAQLPSLPAPEKNRATRKKLFY